MRRVSKLFQPLQVIPKSAKVKNIELSCKSEKLLLELGLVRSTSAGLYTILPLANRVLNKLENLITDSIEMVGGQRLSMPLLTSTKLWKKTGRLEDIGPELMTLEDRHENEYVLAPTYEEAIADLLSKEQISYKQLPLLLYQMSRKYRDEPRPKHGLLRSREFSMLDAYGVHAGAEDALETYREVTEAFARLFGALGVQVHRVTAPSGAMGGSSSHEWQLPAAAGEDIIRVCPSCSVVTKESEMELCGNCNNRTDLVNSIEVGHTFILGTKYSDPLGANFTEACGGSGPVTMSCYGIGASRLLSACLESLATDHQLRWPRLIAPYKALIIGPKEGSKEWQGHGWDAVSHLSERMESLPGYRGEVLVDDRHGLTIGKRLFAADRMGYPRIILCGRAVTEDTPKYELHKTSPGEEGSTPQLLTLPELLEELADDRGRKNTQQIPVENII